MVQVVSVGYLDSAGLEARETILFGDAVAPADIDEWLDAALVEINGVTGAQITDVKKTFNHDISGLGLRASPVTGSRLSFGMRFGLRDTGGQAGSIFIPAVQTTWVAGGEANIGTTGDAPFDLAALLIDGGFTATSTNDVAPSSRAGLVWETFRGAATADRDYK